MRCTRSVTLVQPVSCFVWFNPRQQFINLEPLKAVSDILPLGHRSPYEPPHRITNNMYRRKQRHRSGFAVTAKLIRRLCFCYTDSTILLLSKSKISTLSPSSVTAQPGLCRTWSQPNCKLLVFSRTGPYVKT